MCPCCPWSSSVRTDLQVAALHVSEMLAISSVDSIDIIVARFFLSSISTPTFPLKVKASRRLICPSVRRHVNGADRMNVIDDPIVDGSMESNTPCEPLNLVKHKTKPVAVVAPSAVLEAPPTFSEPSQGRLLKIPKAFSSVDSAKIGDPLRPDGLYSMIHSLVACEHKFLTTLYVNGLMNGSSRPPLGFPLLPGYSGSFLSDVYRGQFGVAPVLGNLLTFADTQRQLWQMVGSPENQLQSSAAQIPCASTSTDTELPLGKKSRGKRSSSMDQKNSTSSTTEGSKNQDSGQTGNNQDKKKPHIKKPLNAFMLYMKEMRAKVVAECTLKESAAINQILGRRVDEMAKAVDRQVIHWPPYHCELNSIEMAWAQWHSLTREEQAKYYEKARQERQLHMQLYPGWSARDNYGYGAKKKKRKKERSTSDTGGTNISWHALGREEQAKYYELARRERQLHMQLYPDWSSRANSSRGKKRKRKQETNDGGNSMKKCRARYGLDQQNQWCKPCSEFSGSVTVVSILGPAERIVVTFGLKERQVEAHKK
uniref:HMG box domain-containing protein n=1 Tax=Timema shepardi TaxID=629360 RepID=A0A7R9G370_TIMSH|nr:unnamed protein product [Timema shepardi]